jgi:catalase
VAGGEKSVAALQREGAALHFVNEAFKHCKAIAATGAGAGLLAASYLGTLKIAGEAAGKEVTADEGVVVGGDGQAGKVAAAFIDAIAQHRHWGREKKDQIPA